ncbi:hypothetical protein DOTSEDRAFT_63540 [Dothistroma septosporum NZE10]|uniref:Uncharacterized protein n=1 Tax=Dothistroma septosporum (strain NZE10 / CBS 128990) TaxID=675120 RepID=M2Y4S0_DOTSN|nr:hypothetical protein DOTSEDRAFT_63540 [Dothistroma septosporum NZE10]
MPACKHNDLCFEPSDHAASIGYKRPTESQRAAATHFDVRSGAASLDIHPSTFPGPLVLPGDELSFNPTYERQDVKSWSRCAGLYTAQRRVVYVVPTPVLSPDVSKWSPKPNLKPVKATGRDRPAVPCTVPTPKTDDVLDYLSAFYHGMPVKILAGPALRFVEWNETSPTHAQPARVGLDIGKEAIGVRVRPSPDGLFDAQLNLDDLLDAAITILPKDAHALLMIVDHDLYEDEEDDFCCGRAYGGSRVSVVSTARYNPVMDAQQEIETQHAWPASHCRWFVEASCGETHPDSNRKTNKAKAAKASSSYRSKSAMRSAVDALQQLSANRVQINSYDLWLGRVCKTASHELGHCFGMDHCVYYACVMQGTSGLTEDAGQPPYLCPVDLAKLFRVTGATETSHETALLAFCERFKYDKLFAAFGAWLKVRLAELEDVRPLEGGSMEEAIVLD